MITLVAAPLIVPPACNGWWCECVTSEATVDPVQAREWMLAGYAARTPRLALRWLTSQSQRLADLISPTPDASWAPASALRSVEDANDAAARLRDWHSVEYDRALRAIHEGALYRAIETDTELRYSLSVRPILTRACPQQRPQTPAPANGIAAWHRAGAPAWARPNGQHRT